MIKAPAVLFVYNRPIHTARLLESLANNAGAEESTLIIYSDGPKNQSDRQKVEEVRRIIYSQKWCGRMKVVERQSNIGLADSIIAGVTEVANRFGCAIVLEDDLILSPQFLNFMNDALIKYRDIHRIMHISGYMFPVHGKRPETFFFRAATCWGWATWSRAWEKFENNSNLLMQKIRYEKGIREFNIRGTFDHYKILENQSKGLADSWAIRWYATLFIENALCLHPGSSLVRNAGHDLSGTHCGRTTLFDTEIRAERITDFTDQIIEDEEMLSRIMKFFKPPIGVRLANKIKGLVS